MFDVLTIAALTDELQRTVLDGRIQKIGLVNPVTVGMEVYADRKRHPLLVSADSNNPRIALAESMPSFDPNLVTPFGLQLRKYLRGAFITGIEQPPLERMVWLSIAKRLPPDNGTRRQGSTNEEQDPLDADERAESEDEQEDVWSDDGITRLSLVVEMMGRHSNLILLDEDRVVMESAKRVTEKMSRVRQILPRAEYAMPPPPDKPDPRRLTSAGAEVLLANANEGSKLADVLVRGLRGVSPQIAREAAFQLTGDVGTSVSAGGILAGQDSADGDETARSVARTVRNLYEPLLTREWDPHLYRDEEGVLVGYAASERQFLAESAAVEPVASISAAIEMASGMAGTSAPKDHAQRRARVVAAIESAIERLDARLRSLNEQHAQVEDAERLRTYGELVYGFIWQIQPGDTELVVDEETTIPLDSSLSAKENAQAYFDAYRKAQSAGETIPERIEAAQRERDYLQQLHTQAQQADGFAAIEALRNEFEEHTGGRHLVGEKHGSSGKKRKQQKRVPAITDADGNAIYIGRSGRQNDEVTFDIAGPEDTWLHARGIPGSHVILRWNQPMPEDDPVAVETAAALAAYYSAARESGTVEIDVARRRHVRKIKGGGPGLVTYRNEYTIPVRPRDEAGLKEEGRLD